MLLGVLLYSLKNHLCTEVQEFKDEKTQVDFQFDGIFLKFFFISILDEIETNGKYELSENDNEVI